MSGIKISNATYGTSSKTVDVTQAVSNNVKDGVLNLSAVSPRSLGVEDPAVGQAKILTINYSINGGTSLTKTVNDNDSLYINAPSQRVASGLQIVKAEYGVQDNMTDVTSAVRNYLKNGSINFVVGFKAVGLPDPNPAKRKHLAVSYTINGAKNDMSLNDGERLTISAPAVSAVGNDTLSDSVEKTRVSIFSHVLSAFKYFLWSWSFFEGMKFGETYGSPMLWGSLSLFMPGFMFWGTPFVIMIIRVFRTTDITVLTSATSSI